MRRILLLNYEFPPLGGGAANATYHLLKEMSGKSVQIDLVTSALGEYKEEQFADNIRIYYLDIGKRRRPHYQTNKQLLTYSWKAYWQARKLMKEHRYDLTHAFFGIPCGYIAMRLGLPYIVSLRGSDVPLYNKRFWLLDRLLFKRLSRKIWKRAKAVIANSEQLKTLAQKTAPKQTIEVIPNGVNVDEFQSAPKQTTGKFTVLYVGRLIQHKGVWHLLKAFNKLNRDGNSELVLVGGGNLKREMKKEVRRLGLKDSVRFLGATPHDQLPPIYRKSDVFVLPSHNEGMSNAMLEAMASGLPVVATDTGDTKRLIDESCVVNKGDSDGIYRTLRVLKNDHEKRSHLSIRNLTVVKKLKWDVASHKYQELYQS